MGDWVGRVRDLGIATLLAVLSGPGVHGDPLNLQFSAKISADQKYQILQDLEILQSRNLSEPSGQLQNYLQLSDVDADSLEDWLGSRIRYILAPGHAVDDKTVEVVKPNAFYPQTQDFMREWKIPGVVDGDYGTMKLAVNQGYSIYQNGKNSGDLTAIDIDGIGRVIVNSPRVGIIQLYEDFFSVIFAKVSAKEVRFIDSVFRVATLFHEARHSDGNGNSLGFTHVMCPPGHPYAGHVACDTPANGSYQVGALMIATFWNGCATGCTEGERSALEILQKDNESRILTKSIPVLWDDTPEYAQ